MGPNHPAKEKYRGNVKALKEICLAFHYAAITNTAMVPPCKKNTPRAGCAERMNIMTQDKIKVRHNGHPLASGQRPAPQESGYNVIISLRRKIINVKNMGSLFWWNETKKQALQKLLAGLLYR